MGGVRDDLVILGNLDACVVLANQGVQVVQENQDCKIAPKITKMTGNLDLP